MYINNYFVTPIWTEIKKDFLKSLNKASDPYIKEAKKTKEAKAHLKAHGDFGRAWHSTQLVTDTQFMDFRNYDPHMRDESKHIRSVPEILPKGSIVVFPSHLWHRVKPVTKGTRYSLVVWHLGYPFK